MRFTKRNNRVANTKMKHAFRFLNGSYVRGKPQSSSVHANPRSETYFRRSMAHSYARDLKAKGYTWQAQRIYNYEHRLDKDHRS